MQRLRSAVANFIAKFMGRANVAGKEVMVVNLTTLPTTDADMKKAFAVSENILWWRALMQTLEVRRQEQVDAGAAAVQANNPLLASGCVYAADVLAEVIKDLQNLRKRSVS
jgi:hypothetical protein